MSDAYTISVPAAGATYPCRSDDTVLRAGLRAGLGLAYECNVGSCGTCKFQVVEGVVEVLWDAAPGLSARDRERGRQLACQCVPRSDAVIKMVVDPHFVALTIPRRFEATLDAVRDLTHDIREFRFQSAAPAAFLPGQYALMSSPGVPGPRAYSMSNIANGEGVWEFVIRAVPGGAGTAMLFGDLQPGSRIALDGPYGMAYLRTEVARHIVCISGGSGIGPMLSIARGWAGNPAMDAVQMDFFYGGRGPRDLCGRDELSALPGFGQRLRFHPAISMPELDPDRQWPGFVGFVHDFVRAVLPPAQLLDSEFYVCGPPPMVQAVTQWLTADIKVSPTRIHYDSFF